MFEFIKGKFVEFFKEAFILDVHGVAYRIAVPSCYDALLPQSSGEVTLYVSFLVRENAHALHGFFTREERDLFEVFLTVSGIGPKAAMSLLSHMKMPDLIAAVLRQDAAGIRVPGVGKKTAERLVLELADKLKEISLPAPQAPLRPFRFEGCIRDAVSALVNLGYTQSAAQKAVLKVAGDTPEAELELSELITAALKSRE